MTVALEIQAQLPPLAGAGLPRMNAAPRSALIPDGGAIDCAIIAIETQPRPGPVLDAQILRAVGWDIDHRAASLRYGWVCRSPWAASWMPMPAPSASVDDAARLVPWGWGWGVGFRGGVPFAWAAAAWPLLSGVPFFECSGMSPALALCRAALFAHRHLAIGIRGDNS